MLGSLQLKTTAALVFFLWLLRSLKNSVNVRLANHLKKWSLLCNFWYNIRYSLSTGDLLTTFDKIWHTGLLHKLLTYEISGQVFGLNLSFLGNSWLQVILDRKSSKEYPVNVGVPEGSILHPTLFLLYINDLFDDVIYNIAVYADVSTPYSNFNKASNLQQQQ